MSKPKSPTPRQQQLMQKYRHGVQYLLPNEKIISEFTPKNKDPFWQTLCTLGLACATLLAIIPMLVNIFSPINYWYGYIIFGMVLEHIFISCKKLIPEVEEYHIYLTDMRLISQKVSQTGRVLSEKDIPRKKLQNFHIQELGFNEATQFRSHLIFFYGLILLILPLNFWSYFVEWIDSEQWLYVVSIGLYELIMFIFWFRYFDKNDELRVERNFSIHAKADQINPPLLSKIGKNFSGPTLNNYGHIFGNLSNHLQKGVPNMIKMHSDSFVGKNTLDIDSKEFFDVAKNYSKEILQNPLRNLIKGTAFDVGFLFVCILTLLLHQNNIAPYSTYGFYLFYGILIVMVIKFFVFVGSMGSFSLHMMSEDPTTLLGNLTVIRPGYQSFTSFIRFIGSGIILFYYTGDNAAYLPMIIAIAVYFITAYLIGAIIYLIVMWIIVFPLEDESTAAYFSGNEILVRQFLEKGIPKNVKGQLVMINSFVNFIHMFYNPHLTETKLQIEGNFNRDFRKIMEFEYKIYYLVFLVIVFSLSFLYPEMFTSWAPQFAAWAITVRTFIFNTLESQTNLTILEIIGIIVFLSQIILVIYFSKILFYFVELREPNLNFQFDHNSPLFLKAKSVQDGIDISWNVRDILAMGKGEYTKRAEDYYNNLKKAPNIHPPQINVPSGQQIKIPNPSAGQKANANVSSPSSPSLSSPPSMPSPINATPSSQPIANGSAQRPMPLRISQIHAGTPISPISPNTSNSNSSNPLPFASPYQVKSPQTDRVDISAATSDPKQKESLEMTALISNQTSKQEELKAGTEFIAVTRETPYMKNLDLSKPANFYLFQIDSHRDDIESQIAWESDNPSEELARFTGLDENQKNTLKNYLQNQPFEVQQRVIHILHYLFLANANDDLVNILPSELIKSKKSPF